MSLCKKWCFVVLILYIQCALSIKFGKYKCFFTKKHKCLKLLYTRKNTNKCFSFEAWKFRLKRHNWTNVNLWIYVNKENNHHWVSIWEYYRKIYPLKCLMWTNLKNLIKKLDLLSWIGHFLLKDFDLYKQVKNILSYGSYKLHLFCHTKKRNFFSKQINTHT